MYSWKNFKESKHFNLQDALSDWGAVRIDPYMVWAFSTNFSYLQLKKDGNNILLPILIEFSRTLHNSNEEDRHDIESLLGGTDFLPFFYKMPETRFATAEVSCNKFFELLRSDASNLIERFDIGIAAKVDSLDQVFGANLDSEIPVKEDEATGLESAGVNEKLPPIVGIIDDGFAFLNQKFQTQSKKSRIHMLWDQNITPGSKRGRLYSQADINSLIDECYRGRESYTTMEELIYRREHMADLARSVSHGTHLLDIAAGKNPNEVEDLDPQELLAVRLQKPQPRFSDTTGMWLKVSAFEALQFLIIAADYLAKNRNQRKRDVAVNLSYGNLAGPHDGSSILEQAIDFAVKTGPKLRHISNVSVHIASGNQRHVQGRANFTLHGLQSQTLHWKVLPDDATPSFLELWLDEKTELKDIRIKVTPPTGEVFTHSGEAMDNFGVGEGECQVLSADSKSTPVCVFVSLPKNKISSGNRPMVLIAVSPTASSVLAAAPPGVWLIEVINQSESTSCSVDAWIQRDQVTFGDPIKGRQSYFADPGYVKFDAFGYPIGPDSSQPGYVQLNDTVSGLATGVETNTVGAYRFSGRDVVDYSGLGKGVEGANTVNFESGKEKTYLQGVSEDSVACEGVIASGTKSGSRVALNGTSVATAYATRHLFQYGSFDFIESDNGNKLKVTEDDLKQKLRRIQTKM